MRPPHTRPRRTRFLDSGNRNGSNYDHASSGVSISAGGDIAKEDAISDDNGLFDLEFTKPLLAGRMVTLYFQKRGYSPALKHIVIDRFSDLVENNEYFITSIPPATRLQQTAGTQKGEHIFINYLRLFGAYQVPMVLANQFLGPSLEQDDEPEAQYYRNLGNIEHQLSAFWRNWEYKNARPIRSVVWRQLFFKNETDTYSDIPSELLLFMAGDDDRIRQWEGVAGELCGGLDGGAHRVCPGKYSQDEVLTAVKDDAAKVGFSSLTVENTSPNTLQNVGLHFRTYKNWMESWESPFRVIPLNLRSRLSPNRSR